MPEFKAPKPRPEKLIIEKKIPLWMIILLMASIFYNFVFLAKEAEKVLVALQTGL